MSTCSTKIVEICSTGQCQCSRQNTIFSLIHLFKFKTPSYSAIWTMVKGYQKAASNEQEDKEATHPLKTADILSILTFSWLNVLFNWKQAPIGRGRFSAVARRRQYTRVDWASENPVEPRRRSVYQRRTTTKTLEKRFKDNNPEGCVRPLLYYVGVFLWPCCTTAFAWNFHWIPEICPWELYSCPHLFGAHVACWAIRCTDAYYKLSVWTAWNTIE